MENTKITVDGTILADTHTSLDADIIRRAGTRTINNGLSIVRPQDYEVEHIHKQQTAPFREAKSVTMSTLQDLVAFCKAESLRSCIDTVYFVGSENVRAVTNYTIPDGVTCGWCDSGAIFKTEQTHEWRTWKSSSGRMMTQEQFCDFLDDNQGNIVDPPGTDIYDLVHDFKMQKNVTYQSSYRTSDGSTRLLYDDDTSKREMTLPEVFVLELPVIMGAEELTTYQVKARLYTRIDKETHKLLISYRLIRPDVPERNATHDIAEWLRKTVAADEQICNSEIYEGILSRILADLLHGLADKAARWLHFPQWVCSAACDREQVKAM